MCGRYALFQSADTLTRIFDLAESVDLAPRYNITPGTAIPVIRRSPAGPSVLHLLHWGLVPRWSRDPAIWARLINARAESAMAKPSFRTAFHQRRCLIPADGFFEWQRQGQTKQPFFFSASDGQVLALGGLWESWQTPDGGLLRSTCILTTAANGCVASVHDRMPLMLAPAAWRRWLAGTAAEAMALLAPAPEATLRAWPVSQRVNRVQEDGPGLIEPAAAPELPLTVQHCPLYPRIPAL
ncbi:MAG: SOS response-associated peptidase [Chromatiaceae bacterium]